MTAPEGTLCALARCGLTGTMLRTGINASASVKRISANRRGE
jgi:hypothetical protein